ncbi:MAG: hypothetical protein ABR500_13630 [Dermatophilaceae bacterium]|nr:hypothetical protein [Intrasporangiaceae bacterium]
MVQSVEQAITLGAYAGSVVLPVAGKYGDEHTHTLIAGLVAELWAGVPLVYDRSDVDDEIGRPHEDTTTARGCADGGEAEASETPQDLVPDMLDMVRTLWQLAHTGSIEELAAVARFRLSEIAAGLDHAYAVRHDTQPPARPGTFEAVVQECLQIVTHERESGTRRTLGDEDLHEHGTLIGEHLVECLEQGSACRLLTKPQVDVLAIQITSLLGASGFSVVPEGETYRAGVLVEVVDDIDLSLRHVSIHWHPGEALRRRCEDAVNGGDYSAEPLRRSGLVREVMGRSLLQLLRAGGFEAHADEDLDPHEVIVTGLTEPEDLASFVGATA